MTKSKILKKLKKNLKPKYSEPKVRPDKRKPFVSQTRQLLELAQDNAVVEEAILRIMEENPNAYNQEKLHEFRQFEASELKKLENIANVYLNELKQEIPQSYMATQFFNQLLQLPPPFLIDFFNNFQIKPKNLNFIDYLKKYMADLDVLIRGYRDYESQDPEEKRREAKQQQQKRSVKKMKIMTFEETKQQMENLKAKLKALSAKKKERRVQRLDNVDLKDYESKSFLKKMLIGEEEQKKDLVRSIEKEEIHDFEPAVANKKLDEKPPVHMGKTPHLFRYTESLLESKVEKDTRDISKRTISSFLLRVAPKTKEYGYYENQIEMTSDQKKLIHRKLFYDTPYIQNLEKQVYDQHFDKTSDYLNKIVNLLVFLQPWSDNIASIFHKNIRKVNYLPQQLLNMTEKEKIPRVFLYSQNDQLEKEISIIITNNKKQLINKLTYDVFKYKFPTGRREVDHREKEHTIIFNLKNRCVNKDFNSIKDLPNDNLVFYKDNNNSYCFSISNLLERFNRKEYRNPVIDDIDDELRRTKNETMKNKLLKLKDSIIVDLSLNFVNAFQDYYPLGETLFSENKHDLLLETIRPVPLMKKSNNNNNYSSPFFESIILDLKHKLSKVSSSGEESTVERYNSVLQKIMKKEKKTFNFSSYEMKEDSNLENQNDEIAIELEKDDEDTTTTDEEDEDDDDDKENHHHEKEEEDEEKENHHHEEEEDDDKEKHHHEKEEEDDDKEKHHHHNDDRCFNCNKKCNQVHKTIMCDDKNKCKVIKCCSLDCMEDIEF